MPSRKQHTENRRTGRSLCGREMPRDHREWSDLESCQACANAAERQDRQDMERALAAAR